MTPKRMSDRATGSLDHPQRRRRSAARGLHSTVDGRAHDASELRHVVRSELAHGRVEPSAMNARVTGSAMHSPVVLPGSTPADTTVAASNRTGSTPGRRSEPCGLARRARGRTLRPRLHPIASRRSGSCPGPRCTQPHGVSTSDARHLTSHGRGGITRPITPAESPSARRRSRPRRRMARRPSAPACGRADRRTGRGGGEPQLRARRGSSRLPARNWRRGRAAENPPSRAVER